MPSKVIQGTSKDRSLRFLRGAALIAVLIGAAGSVGFMLYAGRHNKSNLLLVLFAIWVLSPFVAFLFATVVSKGWPVLTRVTLYSLMLVVSLGCLALYGYVALGPPRAQTAFVFV